jgi:xylan 1,4-beta-xylosidase
MCERLKRFVIFSCLVFAHLVMGATAFAYENSITLPDEWPGYGVGDPFVFKYNGTFYLYCSTANSEVGIKYWTSTDCVNWTYGGLCSTDPLTTTAYAPEVVYWNGMFYLYTSPNGGGHYVFTSTSPRGPFTAATGNLGHSIDGDVFIDDDGNWFFFSAGGDGIHGAPMSSPLSIGTDVVLAGSQIGGQWTEGPTAFERNGLHYLTATGNHVDSTGYRVDVAANSIGPLATYTSSPNSPGNPILLSSEGAHVGLGHNGVFIGPDLDTYYTVYHNLTAVNAGIPDREFNIDALGWNGDVMVPYGPTTWPMQTPASPKFEDRFQRASIGAGYANAAGGTWGIGSGFLTQRTTGNTAFFIEYETTYKTASDYTAEYNVQEVSRGTITPKCGAVFGYQDSQNYGYAVLNGVTGQLQTNLYVGGVWGTEVNSALPAGLDTKQLHTIRIEKTGTTYRFFVDKMLKEVKTNAGLGAGYVGYLSQDDSANFGYIAASDQIGGSGIFDFYKPIPGVIQAVHYNTGGEGVGYHDATPGNSGGGYIRKDDVDIRDSSEGGEAITANVAGEWLDFNVNVQSTDTYNAGIRYATTLDGSQVRVWFDGVDATGPVTLPNTKGADAWRTHFFEGLNLTAGNHTVRVETVTGEFDWERMELSHADNASISVSDNFTGAFSTDWNFSGGSWSIVADAANIDGTGKRTLGSTGWSDYTVECDLEGESALNSGIMVRVQNPAQGGPGDDPVLGSDFYQGYFAGLSETGVVLGRENYGWTTLATTPGSYALSTWYHMKVVVSGNEIQVYVDDMNVPQIDYIDEVAPFTHGKIGLRAHYATTNFDNLTVRHVAPPPTFDAGVTDASLDSSIPNEAGAPPADASPGSSIPNGAGGGCSAAASVPTRTPPSAVALFGVVLVVARRRRRRRA